MTETLEKQLLTQQFAMILDAAGFGGIIPWWGDDIDVSETDTLKETKVYVNTTQSVTEDIYLSTCGYYISGTAFFRVIGPKQLPVVKKMISLIQLGFTNEENRMAPKDHGPFIIGGRAFLNWKPLAVEERAETFGKNFISENAIEFTFKDNE